MFKTYLRVTNLFFPHFLQENDALGMLYLKNT